MPTRDPRIALPAAALLLMAAGCSPSPPRPLAMAPDGVWKGQTSQGRPIEVTVKDNAVVSLKVGFHLLLDSPCARPGSRVAVNYRGGEAAAFYLSPVAIDDGAFTAHASLDDVTAKIEGVFTVVSVTGTVDLQPISSSDCSGRSALTFTARPVPPGS